MKMEIFPMKNDRQKFRSRFWTLDTGHVDARMHPAYGTCVTFGGNPFHLLRTYLHLFAFHLIVGDSTNACNPLFDLLRRKLSPRKRLRNKSGAFYCERSKNHIRVQFSFLLTSFMVVTKNKIKRFVLFFYGIGWIFIQSGNDPDEFLVCVG